MRSARLTDTLRQLAPIGLLAALLAAPAYAAGDVTLQPYAATYKVKISFLSGELTARLTRDGDRYVAVHRVAATGLARALVKGAIEESSVFLLGPDGIRPIHYVSENTIAPDKDQADVDFDWARHLIVGDVNGESVTIPFDDAAHDRISIQYTMMRDMIAGEKGRSYTLFDFDKFKTLEITFTDERKVKVPAGTFQTIGIKHQTKGSSRITTLWCAPELGYMPVIIEQHRKGKLNMHAELAEYEKLSDR